MNRTNEKEKKSNGIGYSNQSRVTQLSSFRIYNLNTKCKSIRKEEGER